MDVETINLHLMVELEEKLKYHCSHKDAFSGEHVCAEFCAITLSRCWDITQYRQNLCLAVGIKRNLEVHLSLQGCLYGHYGFSKNLSATTLFF